jgi:hypothetical protein
MTILQDVSPEQLATLFFHYSEALAPDFECDSVNSSWETVSSNERKRMVAAARLVLLDLAAAGKSAVRQGDGSSWQEGTEGKECGC